MFAMIGPEALRDENLNKLPKQLGSLVAEEFFGFGIDENNAAIRSDDDHGVRSGVEQRKNAFLSLLALGNIADGAGDQSAGIPLNRA
jgi:hypothetical protein